MVLQLQHGSINAKDQGTVPFLLRNRLLAPEECGTVTHLDVRHGTWSRWVKQCHLHHPRVTKWVGYDTVLHTGLSSPKARGVS